LGGCGTTETPDSSTVYIDKRGNVTSVDIEELDQGYYDEEELSTYIDDSVSEYVEANGKNSVKVKSFEVDGDMAILTMKYKSGDDYSQFNDIEFYTGKVVDSLAEGYVYDVVFSKVTDGEIDGSATKQDIYGEDGLKVVIISANINVEVPGDICYISSDNAQLLSSNTASVKETEDAAFIIYK
jgi:hypothetical protein